MRLKCNVKRHLWAVVSIGGNLPHFFLFFSLVILKVHTSRVAMWVQNKIIGLK